VEFAVNREIVLIRLDVMFDAAAPVDHDSCAASLSDGHEHSCVLTLKHVLSGEIDAGWYGRQRVGVAGRRLPGDRLAST
jgi:hypothetical protein